MSAQPRNPVAHLTLRHGSWVWSDEKLTLKLLLVGDAAVGKTSLIRRFVNDEFEEEYEPTIGADLAVKEVMVDGHDVAVQLWDTAGSTGNQTIGKSFYKGTQLVVLVFDLTSRKSFESLQQHYDRILTRSGFSDLDSFPCMVVGNKRDAADISVSLEEVEDWCSARRPHSQPIMYVTTSAKEGTNTVEAFEHLVSMALEGVRRAAPQAMHPPVSPKATAPASPSPRKSTRPDGSWIQPSTDDETEYEREVKEEQESEEPAEGLVQDDGEKQDDEKQPEERQRGEQDEPGEQQESEEQKEPVEAWQEEQEKVQKEPVEEQEQVKEEAVPQTPPPAARREQESTYPAEAVFSPLHAAAGPAPATPPTTPPRHSTTLTTSTTTTTPTHRATSSTQPMATVGSPSNRSNPHTLASFNHDDKSEQGDDECCCCGLGVIWRSCVRSCTEERAPDGYTQMAD